MTLRPTDSSTLLIDGKLVPGSGGTFEILDPGTEEVLGHAADGTAADHRRRHRRRAPRLRRHRLVPRPPPAGALPAAASRRASREHIEELREITIAEVGAPRFLTSAAHLEGPVDDLAGSPIPPRTTRGNSDLGKRRPDGNPDPSRICSAKPSAWSARSPRGTSRTRSTSPRSGPHSPRATPWCSSPHPTPRGAQRCSARSSPSTPTSRPVWSTSSPPATTASARCSPKTRGWTWFRSPGRPPPAER